MLGLRSCLHVRVAISVSGVSRFSPAAGRHADGELERKGGIKFRTDSSDAFVFANKGKSQIGKRNGCTKVRTLSLDLNQERYSEGVGAVGG